MYKAFFALFLFLYPPTLSAQKKTLPKYYSPEQVNRLINIVVRNLDRNQPGAYRYYSRQDFTMYVDSIKATVKDSLTELGIYQKIKPIVSKIGCLHTDLALSEGYKNYLNQSPNLFPFKLYFQHNRAYVIKNYSTNQTISPGDEILSINGNTIAHIIEKLLPVIPADGYNVTMKYLALYHQFPSWYRHTIEVTGDFEMKVLSAGKEKTYQVKGRERNDLAENGFLQELQYAKQLEFRVENNTGYLTIHTFSNSDIKRSGQQYKEFIDKTFEELKNKTIPNLVVDLRYNTGGSDGNAAYFSSYFFDQPYRYWSKIVVTDRIAKQIRGIASIWYRKPVKEDSIWLWRKGKRTTEFDYIDIQQPAPNNYNGKVYVLTNGFSMSSCADVASILQYNKKATVIGEETGGGYQGNNSGIMPGINLKPTKMVLVVPLQKYYNAVDTTNFGRGVMPDIPVTMSVAEMMEGKDKVMETVVNLIRTGKK